MLSNQIQMTMHIVTVSAFTQGENKGFDKNGLQSVYLTGIAGSTIPDKTKVISGTVADSAGLVIGECYAVQIEQLDDDVVYGEQFRVSVIKKLSFADIMSAGVQMGVIKRVRKVAEVEETTEETEVVAGKKAGAKLEI